MSKKNETEISRRDFLKTAAVVTAGVAAGNVTGAFSPKPAMAQAAWRE